MKLQAIKLRIHQDTASYKNPVSHDFGESYPLAPYSTIIGMIHYLCDFHEYHPMQISVQGNHVSTTTDLYTSYEFSNGTKFDKTRHNLNVNGLGITRGINKVQLLVDINTIVHIVPNDPTELNVIYQALKYPREFPNLGRREDLVQLDAQLVTLDERILDTDFSVENGAYLPIKQLNEDFNFDTNDGSGQRGTAYEINKNYKLIENHKGHFSRLYQKIPILYASEFSLLSEGKFLFDNEDCPVFLA